MARKKTTYHKEKRYIIVFYCPAYCSRQQGYIFKTREEAQYYVDEWNLQCNAYCCYGVEEIEVLVKDN